MTTLVFRQYAGTWERFSEEAAASMVGKDFQAKVGEQPIGTGRVIHAKVVDEGHAVELTVDWPGEVPGRNDAWSIGTTDRARCPGYPNCTCPNGARWSTPDDPHGAFGAPGMMGG